VAPHKGGALTAGATIVFIDESGFSQRPSVRRTWAPRGRTPVVEDHVNWDRLSAVGAIAWHPGKPDTRVFLSLWPHSIKQPEVLEFLKSLHRHVHGQVVVVWDRLPAHRGNLVREYIEANASWLKVEFLPPYAPELNPVEQVWANLRARELANYTPDDLGELAVAIERGKRRIRRRGHGLGFIKHTDLLSDDDFNLLCKAH
jgi:transposase